MTDVQRQAIQVALDALVENKLTKQNVFDIIEGVIYTPIQYVPYTPLYNPYEPITWETTCKTSTNGEVE